MHLRYQVQDPDGKVVYATESMGDAKRQWKLHMGSGCILVDVLQRAGYVEIPGDMGLVNQITDHAVDTLMESLCAVTGEKHVPNNSILRAFFRDAVERHLVEAARFPTVGKSTLKQPG